MPLALETKVQFVGPAAEYIVLSPSDDDSDWLQSIAQEYVNLRTYSPLPLADVSVEGIQVLDVGHLRLRLRAATIPPRHTKKPEHQHLEVIRSDFGETVAYMVLAQNYGTQFGYKSVRDRELIRLPGRGIDAVGIEDGNDTLSLVLTEVKASADKRSPPGVVDAGDDCLAKQHRGHLQDLQGTADKIFDLARRCTDRTLRDLFMAAATWLEEGQADKLRIVVCCVLIRPGGYFTDKDFGSFLTTPEQYSPAAIRFLVLCVPDDIEGLIDRWYTAIEAAA